MSDEKEAPAAVRPTETHPEVYDGLRRRHARKQIVETGHWTNMCKACGETWPCSTNQLLGERDGLFAERTTAAVRPCPGIADFVGDMAYVLGAERHPPLHCPCCAARVVEAITKLLDEFKTLARRTDTLRDVARSGMEQDDPRLRYVTVQIDRETWEEARRALDDGGRTNR